MHRPLAILLFCLVSSLYAQEMKNSDEQAVPCFHIQFAGGTVNDLLAQIEKETKQEPNVICTAEAGQTQLPPFKLQSVTARDILRALEALHASTLRVMVNSPIMTISSRKEQDQRLAAKEEERSSGNQQLFSLEFAGGSVGDLLSQMEKEGRPNANIICTSDAGKVSLPPFRLYRVTTRDLVQALGVVAPALQVTYKDTIATVRCLETRKTVLKIEMYCLETHLKTYKVEDLVTAIQTAWEMQGTEISGKLKFHPDTKLLIALGTNEEQDIIKMTLKQLSTGLNEERKENKNR